MTMTPTDASTMRGVKDLLLFVADDDSRGAEDSEPPNKTSLPTNMEADIIIESQACLLL